VPNPDNTKWIGMVLGREITPGPPMQSVDEIPGRRAFWDVEAMQPLAPPRLAATHEVELREGLRGELYVPDGEEPFPCLLYLHGGWFVMWSAAHVRRIAMRIAERGFLVLNLDYRLAPEHPFPAAVEDAAFAARWLRDNAAVYGGDPSRVLVGGDSVGATLSATTIVAAEVELKGALLLYGVFDVPGAIAEPLTNAGLVEISTLAYLGTGFTSRWREPLVSPFYADVSGFPPCYVSCGDEDSLLSQSLAMARKLHLANVPLTMSVVQGADHGFVYLEHVLPGATPEVERFLDWLEATA
jgi:acetyl esterase/lipase